MAEIDDYDYRLPKQLIAQYPLPERTDARLMVVDRTHGSLVHCHVRDLPELLEEGDALVINDTRVVPARLVGRRESTGGHWEGLFLRVDDEGNWRLLAKTRGRQRPGELIRLVNCRAEDDVRLSLVEQRAGGEWLARCESTEPPLELLERVGRIPLPHYIRGGEMYETDRQDYQTVYSRHAGSVAAPTAGLHFTEKLLARLVDRGVVPLRVTLHVGVGTFRPVKTETLAEHAMHAEWAQLDAATAERITALRAAGGRVVAVGTTSLRTLETAARDGTLRPFSGETDLFIRPGFTFHAVDALLTNFHLPRSTLLVLVRTFGGDALMRRAYEEAVARRYRFYSYGDAMLIL